MAPSYDLYECTRQMSEHASALWTEASMLTLLTKELPGGAPHCVVQLARKSAELCRLAQAFHEIMDSPGNRCMQSRVPRLLRSNGPRPEGSGPSED